METNDAENNQNDRINALFTLQEEITKISINPAMNLFFSSYKSVITVMVRSAYLAALWFVSYFTIKFFYGISLLDAMDITDEWSHLILIPTLFWFFIVGLYTSFIFTIVGKKISSKEMLSGDTIIKDIENYAALLKDGFQSNAKLAKHLLYKLENENTIIITLQEDNQKLARRLFLLDQLSVNILWMLDAKDNIIFIDQTIQKITGHLTPELIGKNFSVLAPAAEQTRLRTFVESVRCNTGMIRFETWLRRKDGTDVHVNLTAIATQEAKIEDRCVQGAVVEITRQGEIEKAVMENLPLIINITKEPAFLTTTASVDGILACQLADVIVETEKAAYQISGFAHDLDASMATLWRILSTANEHTSEFGKSSQQMVEEDQQAIHDLKNFISQAEVRQKSGQERVRVAMDQVRGLQNLVHVVMELSEHTTVLALNARIVAARAGEHGHKFTVVANEVKKLAMQTRDVAKQIEEGITRAAATVEDVLSDHINGRQAQNEEAMLRKSSEQMVRLGEHHRNLISFNEVTMRQMTEWNQTVSERVVLLVCSIQFQDIVRQRVELVINALGRRRSHADALVEKLLNPGKEIAIEQLSVEDLFRDYVMEDQRRSHQQAIGGQGKKVTTEPPMVELF